MKKAAVFSCFIPAAVAVGLCAVYVATGQHVLVGDDGGRWLVLIMAALAFGGMGGALISEGWLSK